MIGDETLVPPKTSQPPTPYESYTETPVPGSATAETSATVRREQPLSLCHAGFGMTVEQPLPAPAHTVSDQPRALAAVTRWVPPTATTPADAAGYMTPYPESPLDAVM